MHADPAEPESGHLRLVFVGDTVGKPGVRIACQAAGWFRQRLGAGCLLINAENAADGSGLGAADYRRLVQAGYDGITLGDHLYKKKEIIPLLNSAENIVRPCNLPAAAAGKPSMLLTTTAGVQVAVISALGRVFMKPMDCPFQAIDRQLKLLPDSVTIRLVDFHAEATSEKQLMGRYLDGRVSAVLGTHTHVATADEQILPGGTAFQCDVGMTGPFDSIIGRSTPAVLESTLTGMPLAFHVAKEDLRVSATWLDVCTVQGRCHRLGRLCLTQRLLDEYLKSTQPDRTKL